MHARVALASLLAVVFLPGVAAATDVVGNLNVDTRWTLAGSPYVLTGDVTVAPQATLTIEPGVSVEAAATDALGAGTSATTVELIVRGALLADGEAGSPVVFRGVTLGPASWYGISFEPGARASSLTYVTLSDAEYGLSVRSTAPVTLSDIAMSVVRVGVLWQTSPGPALTRVVVDGPTADGIQLADDGISGATAQLTDCMVRGSAAAGVAVFDRVSADVRRTHLVGNAVGLAAAPGSGLVFTNNVVVANTSVGLRLSQTGVADFTIVNNTIDRNVGDPFAAGAAGTGVHVLEVSRASAFVVRNNLVTNHGTAGIQVDGPVPPSLDHNDVWGNGTDYVGCTAGVGSISANPLYALGYGGTAWTFVANPISVRGPGNNYSNSWTFTQDGAGAVRAVVTYLNTESGWDFVRMYDGNGALVDTFNGVRTGTSNYAVGRTMRVDFTTDGSNYSDGFDISGFEVRPAGYNYRLQASSPAIDVGNDLGAPGDDSDGTARPYDGDVNGTATTDMGAYEWHENIPPIAVAGPDRVTLPNVALGFDAVGSRDPDGTITLYRWDFGDATPVENGSTATHTYTALGAYTVTLTVVDDQGVSSTDTAQVTVTDNLPPVADAGPDQSVGVSQAVSFDGGGSTDADGTVVGYAWDFGDGTPAGSGRTVTHAFSTTGRFTVTLTVTDDRGATGTDTAIITVGGGGNTPPIAEAGGPQTVSLGAAVTLDGSASTDSDGTIVSWSWDFGDGAPAGSGRTVTHTFATGGAFLVTLTVTDDGGATDTDSTLVTVQTGTNLPPVADAGGPYAVAVGAVLSFDGSRSRDADGSIRAYDWEFGDGTSGSGATATHTYAAAGTYLVRLTVTDDGGLSDDASALVTVSAPDNDPPVADAGGNRSADVGETLSFDGRGSTDPDGSVVAWAWDFGDGSTGAGAQATHAYVADGTYLVWLTVTDDDGAIGQDVAVVTVGAQGNRAPVADAGANQQTDVGVTVTLDASGSFDPDGAIVAYAWDLGDGQTATGAVVTHAYGEPGSYLVGLTVTDDGGATGEDFVLVSVGGGGGENQLPVAAAGDDVSANEGDTLTFSASASTDPDGSVIAWQWDFGDGGTGSGLSATHVYQAGGTYTVTLTVIDDDAGRATDTLTATINSLPVASAGPARTAKLGEQVNFDAGASLDPDGTIVAFAWDFGDGQQANGQQVQHSWDRVGPYTVTLAVTDDKGATGSATAQVIIEALEDSAPGASTPPTSGGCGCGAGADGSGSGGGAVGLLLGALALAMTRRRR